MTARQRARELAAGLDLTSTDQTLLATAISEVARNITTYAKRGEVLLSIVRDNGGREGIRVVARDEGPGIEDIELRAAGRLHVRRRARARAAGRAAARRRVRHRERARARARRSRWSSGRGRARADDGWPAELERGVAGLAIEGEERSGDLAVFAPYAGGGAGGRDRRARPRRRRRPTRRRSPQRVIRAHAADAPPRSCCSAATRRCARRRGVVMTLAWFDLERRELSWAGVGNVEARLVRGAAAYGDRHDSALVLGGVVGYNLPAGAARRARTCGRATRSRSPPTGSRPTTRPR